MEGWNTPRITWRHANTAYAPPFLSHSDLRDGDGSQPAAEGRRGDGGWMAALRARRAVTKKDGLRGGKGSSPELTRLLSVLIACASVGDGLDFVLG